jgi:hypothetical protein
MYVKAAPGAANVTLPLIVADALPLYMTCGVAGGLVEPAVFNPLLVPNTPPSPIVMFDTAEPIWYP